MASAAYLVADTSGVGFQPLSELLPGLMVRRERGDLPYAFLVALLAVGLVITAIEIHQRRQARPE